MTNPKTLTEMLEAMEPESHKDLCAFVQRKDYDRMKRVAIELAKACEIASVANSYHDVGPTIERGCYASKSALSRAKDIIGEGK